MSTPSITQQNSYKKRLSCRKIAADYLRKKGLFIIEQNFYCRYGEIDLICKTNDNEVIFFEVRYKKNSSFCTPEETINYIKQKKIMITAEYFLAKNKWSINLPCRIDVIAISGILNHPNIKWIKNAIEVI